MKFSMRNVELLMIENGFRISVWFEHMPSCRQEELVDRISAVGEGKIWFYTENFPSLKTNFFRFGTFFCVSKTRTRMNWIDEMAETQVSRILNHTQPYRINVICGFILVLHAIQRTNECHRIFFFFWFEFGFLSRTWN